MSPPTLLANIVRVLQAPGRIQAFLRTLAGRSPELVRASVWLREVSGLVEWQERTFANDGVQRARWAGFYVGLLF